jgi:hypothetical protein
VGGGALPPLFPLVLRVLCFPLPAFINGKRMHPIALALIFPATVFEFTSVSMKQLLI